MVSVLARVVVGQTEVGETDIGVDADDEGKSLSGGVSLVDQDVVS